MKEAHKEIVEGELSRAKQRITAALPNPDSLSPEQMKNIIGTYRIAVEPNFIPWMYMALDTASSKKAKAVLAQNIRDEIEQDHPKMLRDFTNGCGVQLTQQHYQRASLPVKRMWDLISPIDGVSNLAVAATLENTSLVFIPYLAAIGKRLGCRDFTYTDMHGEADIEHAKQLYEGLVEEMLMPGVVNPWNTVASAVSETCSFLEQILRT